MLQSLRDGVAPSLNIIPKMNEAMNPMRKSTPFLLLAALAVCLLVACGTQVTPVPSATLTPDPCAPGNITAEVKKVNDLQRQFDDGSQLASVLSINQLAVSNAIPSLQALRRQAQDQTVPGCLTNLKNLQLQQMNTVINTFLAFLAGGSQSPNTQLLSQGVAQARGLHDQYNQELAHLIGATYVPPASTAAPSGTPAGAAPTSTPTP